MPTRPTAADDPVDGVVPWWTTAALGLALIVGLVARFATRSPLWLDEALSVNIAALPLGDIAAALRHDGHPPLYYWVLHGWIELFGGGDVAVRSLSGVFSAATLPALWAVGRRLGGREAAMWAVGLLALSPYAVRYATEARMYALVMLLVSVGFLLLTDVLKDPQWRKVMLLAGTVAALLWTHYWSLYLLGVVGAALLWQWWRVPARRRGTTGAISALALGAAAFLPWVPSFMTQMAHTGTPWAVPSRPAQVLDVTLADLGGGGFSEARGYGAVIVILLFLAAYSTRNESGRVEVQRSLVPRTRPAMIITIGTLAAGSVSAWVVGGAYASRYAAVVIPIVLALAAVALALLPRGWPLALLALAALAFSFVGIFDNARTPRTQAGDLAATIEKRAGPADLVVVCPDQLGPSIERVLDQGSSDLDVLPYPAAGNAAFVDWTDYAKRNKAADPSKFAKVALDRADGGDIWLVWNGSYRTFGGQCEKLVRDLGKARRVSVVARSDDSFESAELYRFGKARPGPRKSGS